MKSLHQARDVAKEIYMSDEDIKKTSDKLAGQLDLRLADMDVSIYEVAKHLLDLSLARLPKVIILVAMASSLVFGFDYVPDRIWGSYSERTPKLDTARSGDYEVLAGLQNSNYIFDGGFERENDEFYRLCKVNVRSNDWRDLFLECEYLLKEAYGINSQSVRGLYKAFRGVPLLDKLSFGASMNMVKWQDLRGLFSVSFRTKAVQFAWETNFKDRMILSYKVGFDIPIGKKFVLNPFKRYENNNGKTFSQNKISLSYLVKE